MKKRLKILPQKTALLLLTFMIGIAPILQSFQASATDSLWMNGQLQFVNEGKTARDVVNGTTISCNLRKATIQKSNGTTEEQDSCMVDTSFGTFGSSYYGQLYQPPGSSRAGVIKDPSSLAIVPTTYKNKGVGIYAPPNGLYHHYFYIYNDNRDLIKKRSPVDGLESYKVSKQPDTVFKYPDGNPVAFKNAKHGFSTNGRWILSRHGDNLVRIDLETLEVISFNFFGSGNLTEQYAISNDGRYGFVSRTGWLNSAQIVDFAQCSSPSFNAGHPFPTVTNCGVRDIAQDVANFSGTSPNSYTTWPEFSSDSKSLRISMYVNNELTTVSIVAPGQEYSGLDYLALGDSFASGEGDNNGKTQYLAGTDVPISDNSPKGEKCHVSRRSYSYLLARQMSVTGDRFKNVACSGAVINDITGSDEYHGQADRLIKEGRTTAEIKTMQKEALDDFIPGRVRQIDFVEKYKPKVVTISIGGNDVDFSKVLADCFQPFTCDYASDTAKRGPKAYEIMKLGQHLKKTYKEVYKRSPNTKMYVVGYPKILKKDGSCNTNVHFNTDERELLNNGTSYLNDVIEAAAKRAGVMYLDVEDAIGEAALCGGDSEKAVNGLVKGDDLPGDPFQRLMLGVLSSYYVVGVGNESYHPNEKGHIKLAQKISSLTNNSLLNHQYCPVGMKICPDSQSTFPIVPSYFTQTPVTVIPDKANIVDLWAKPGDTKRFQAPYLLKPNSSVTVEMHSNPVSLGTFTTDSNGKFDQQILLPGTLEPGIHTIHIKGTLISEEQVDLYQSVLVVDSEEDIDNNDTQDSAQGCLFVPTVNVDTDFDGNDDSCDGFVGEPELYRVRNGDPNSNENDQWIYIERNTRASSVTGIQGDHDPDGDGWAIVAHSTSVEDSGIPANFWVDQQNVPHVSVRHPAKGCVQFTPASLTVVQPNAQRTLQQEASNTNTCRAEAPSYDVDWNGIPDNQQPLYRARNGDIAKAEDPNDVYIERNQVAAEAQLGISDFASNDGWAVVGKSNDVAEQGEVSGEVIIENGTPFVCVSHSSGEIVLTPELLAHVKQSESRYLKIDATNSVSCGP